MSATGKEKFQIPLLMPGPGGVTRSKSESLERSPDSVNIKMSHLKRPLTHSGVTRSKSESLETSPDSFKYKFAVDEGCKTPGVFNFFKGVSHEILIENCNIGYLSNFKRAHPVFCVPGIGDINCQSF